MSWEGGRYDSGDPQADNAARLAWLRRQRNLGQGWHHGGWKVPQAPGGPATHCDLGLA
jgi:hypothetical protein